MTTSEELREKLRRVALLKEIQESHRADLVPPVSDPSGLLKFVTEYPEPRRWYLARVTDPEDGEVYVDLYFAPPSEIARATIEALDASGISALKEDDPSWWQGEEFDLTFHVSEMELREILEAHGGYSADQPLVEGMVFVEIHPDGSLEFIPFTFQARQASKAVYKKLFS